MKLIDFFKFKLQLVTNMVRHPTGMDYFDERS